MITINVKITQKVIGITIPNCQDSCAKSKRKIVERGNSIPFPYMTTKFLSWYSHFSKKWRGQTNNHDYHVY